jgi:hypothetical protein
VEAAFCQKIGAGGNQLVAATVGGRRLAESRDLRMRSQELGAVLDEYRQLTRSARTPPLEDAREATPAPRPVPSPPPAGLVLRAYCTYLVSNDGAIERSREFYYKENPDRWAAETQSDMLWLTEAEWKSLLPLQPEPGQRTEVNDAIQRRFFSTVGIDFMEGSVNSLPVRQSTMSLTVERVTGEAIAFRLDGFGQMGKPWDENRRSQPHSRGCELRVLGFLNYDRGGQRFDRFDLVGVGAAWGNKMDYVRREIRLDRHPWMYGIACELVSGDAAIDRIPPYNLLHYGSAGAYFSEP